MTSKANLKIGTEAKSLGKDKNGKKDQGSKAVVAMFFGEFFCDAACIIVFI